MDAFSVSEIRLFTCLEKKGVKKKRSLEELVGKENAFDFWYTPRSEGFERNWRLIIFPELHVVIIVYRSDFAKLSIRVDLGPASHRAPHRHRSVCN